MITMLDAPQNDLKDKLAKLHRDGEERAAQRLAEKLGLSLRGPWKGSRGA